jgi:hypothetical protein
MANHPAMKSAPMTETKASVAGSGSSGAGGLFDIVTFPGKAAVKTDSTPCPRACDIVKIRD